MSKAKNRAMEAIERLRIEAGVSKTEMSPKNRAKYYDHLNASDIKVETLREYAGRLGYEIGFIKKL